MESKQRYGKMRDRKRSYGKQKQGKAVRAAGVFLLTAVLLAGCGQPQAGATEETPDAVQRVQNETGPLRMGLILTSRDDPENQETEAAFQSLAQELGAELLVETPDVTASDAGEARALEAGTFIPCDVDAIEYQMLATDALVAEGVSVIAIHPNHAEALESVLSAARGVGIYVAAFADPVTDASADACVGTAVEAAELIKNTFTASK